MFNATPAKAPAKANLNPYSPKRPDNNNDDNPQKLKRTLNQATANIKIVLDTETTGLSPQKGERICEIACIEIDNFEPTGKVFHQYINPDRKMSAGAFKVHGLSNDFLKDKPLFKDIADTFLEFIGNNPLVIHNAPFDIKFLNSELNHIGKPELENEIIDTLPIARKKFPKQKNKLDDLCQRFDVSLADRTKHGALIDTELLAQVYRNLCQEASPSQTASLPKEESQEPTPKKMRHTNPNNG